MVQTVLDDAESIGVEAPVDEAVDEETGSARRSDRRRSSIDRDEAFAAQEGRGEIAGKQALQSAGDGAVAEAGAAGLHHLAVVVADGEVFVERDDEHRVRQGPADPRRAVSSPRPMNMVEMHDVGLQDRAGRARDRVRCPRCSGWTSGNGRSRRRGRGIRAALAQAHQRRRAVALRRWPTRAR